jgi:hypothetical protein
MPPKKKPTPKPPDPKVFLEVDDKRLPFVDYQNWTIDDLFAVTATLPGNLTPAAAYDKFVSSTHAAAASPHLFAMVWWVARRHQGPVSWPQAKAEVDNAEKLNVDVVTPDEDEDPDSPES